MLLDMIVDSAKENYEVCDDWLIFASELSGRSKYEITEEIGQAWWNDIRNFSDVEDVPRADHLLVEELGLSIKKAVKDQYAIDIDVYVDGSQSELSFWSVVEDNYLAINCYENFSDYLYIESGQCAMNSLLDEMNDSLDLSGTEDGLLGVVARNDSKEIKQYFEVNDAVLSTLDIEVDTQLPAVTKDAIATALFIQECVKHYAEQAGRSPVFTIAVNGLHVVLMIDEKIADDIVPITSTDDSDVFDNISNYLSHS